MASSEHVLLSSDKYGRIMQRLKDYESSGGTTEGDTQSTSDTNASEAHTVTQSRINNAGERQVDTQSDQGVASADNDQIDDRSNGQTREEQRVPTGNNTGRKSEQRSSGKPSEDKTSVKRRITKLDLQTKLRPPGTMAKKRGPASKPSRDKGSKKRKWEKLS